LKFTSAGDAVRGGDCDDNDSDLQDGGSSNTREFEEEEEEEGEITAHNEKKVKFSPYSTSCINALTCVLAHWSCKGKFYFILLEFFTIRI
jgi:hypothetical protein